MKKLFPFVLLIILFPFFTSAHGGQKEDFTIRMTKNGFEPKEMTVNQGDEVLFINNDTVPHWPASDFHPTHELYPEFDSLKGVLPGDSYKMKFEKVGTWRMHDHLLPHHNGFIVVLADPNRISSTSTEATSVEPEAGHSRIKTFIVHIWQSLKDFFIPRKSESVSEKSSESVISPLITLERLSEFKTLTDKDKYAFLEKISDTESPEAAWQYVKATYNTPKGVVGNPHDLAHLVGQLLFKKEGFKGLAVCEPIFAFGCYHGLMEKAFYKNSPAEYAKNLLAAEVGCNGVGDNNSPSHWSCVHGIGHGIATYRDFDLPKTLKDCDQLSERMRTYCTDGVFMESSISALPSFYKPESPIYPCDKVGDSYNTSCARAQVQVMKQRFKMNTNAIATACIATNIKNIIYHCIDALGYAAGQGGASNPEKVVASCNEISDETGKAQCTAAAAGELVFQNSAGWQDSVKKICGSLKEEFQPACNARVENVKKSYGRN